MNNKKILSGLLLLSIVFSLFPTITITKASSLNHIPAFPEDLEMSGTDWVETDWYGSTVLPEDKKQYEQEYQALIEEGKYDEAASLEMKKTQMYDEKSYKFYQVPTQVQNVVTQHFKESEQNNLQGIDKKQLLKEKIRSALSGENISVQGSFSPLPEGRGAGGDGGFPQEGKYSFSTEDELPEIKISAFEQKEKKIISVEDGIEVKNIQTIQQENKSSSDIGLQSTLPSVMDYYEGIEKNAMDYALYSIIQKQNSDGSIGKTQKSRNTFAFLNMMKNIYRTNTGEFQKAQSYFVNLEPKNNLELIYKISVLADKSLDYSTLKSQLDAQMNQDNGIGLIQGYSSDFYTSLESAYLYGSLGDTQKYIQLLNYLLPNIQSDGSIKYENSLNFSHKFLSYKMWQVLHLGTFDGKQNYIDILEGFLATDQDSQTIFDTSITSLYLEDKKDFDAVENYQNYIEYEQENNGLFGDIFSSIYATQAIGKSDIVGKNIIFGNAQHYAPLDLTVEFENIGYKAAYNVSFQKYVNLLQTGGDIFSQIEVLAPNINAQIDFSLQNTIKYKGDTQFDIFLQSDNERGGKNNWITQNIFFEKTSDNKAKFPDYFIAYSHEINSGYGFNIRWNNDYIDEDLYKYYILYRDVGTQEWNSYPMNTDSNGAFVSGFELGKTIEVNIGVSSVSHSSEIRTFSTPVEVEITSNENPQTSNISGNISIDGNNYESLKIDGYGYVQTTDFDGSYEINLKKGKNILTTDDPRFENFKKYLYIGNDENQYDVQLNTRFVEDIQKPIVHNIKLNNDLVVKNNRDIEIAISATDNIDVKNIDLYYFHPNYNSWIFIDTIEMNYSVEKYFWNLDNSFLGEGYKLKAVARDWSENISDSLEYGPFTILDGTGPSGTISLSKNEVQLGEDFGFQVNVGDISKFKNLANIDLVYGDIHQNIESYLGGLDTTNQILSVPYRSDFIGNNVYIELRICNLDGSCTQIQSKPFNIVDINFSLPQKWENKGDIGFSLSNGDYNRSLHNIEFGPNNTIELVYSDFYKFTGRTYQLIYRKYENGSWNSPQILRTQPNSRSGDEYELISGVHVHTKNNQTLVGFYNALRDQISDPFYLQDQSEVFMISILDGQKQWEKQVSNDNTFSYSIKFGIDKNHLFHILWREGQSSQTGEGYRILKTTTIDNHGNIGNISELTQTGFGYNADFYLLGEDFFIGYEGAETKYYLRKYNYLNNMWGEKIFAFLDVNMNDYHLFKNSGENLYDIFFKKSQGAGPIGTAYNISHIQFRLENNVITVLEENNVTAGNNQQEIEQFDILQSQDSKYHVMYKKFYTFDSESRRELRYSLFDGNLLENYLLVSPTAKLEDYVFASYAENKISVAYATEISQTRTTKYLQADLNKSDTGGEFQFPEIEIDFEMTLTRFGFTFLIEGYRIRFWIDIF